MFRRHVLLSLSAFLMLSTVAQADEQPTQKLNDAAQAAFDDGKYKKAELSWTRAVKTMEENGQKDSYLEVCLKKLGQTKKRLQQTVEAYQTLMRAYEMCNLLGVQDQELAQELTDLSTSYRAVDVAALGDGTASALRKANVGGVGLLKTVSGTMMRVDLPEKFEKHLDDERVDGLEFDKLVTLDLAEEPDGTVFLKNIKGLKIHSKEKNMWVNLIDTVVKPVDTDGQYPAQVTAGKMGVTKTVDAKLPAKGFEPISGLLKQLHAMVQPLQVVFAQGAIGSGGSSAVAAVVPVTVNEVTTTTSNSSAATSSPLEPISEAISGNKSTIDTGSSASANSSQNAQVAQNLILLVDCSDHMGGKVSGSPIRKMDLSRNVIADLIMSAPRNMNVAIRTFGDGKSEDDGKCCAESSLLMPLARDRKPLLERIANLTASNKPSNLQFALGQIIKTNVPQGSSPTLVVLISGGGDQCGGNAAEYCHLYLANRPDLRLLVLPLTEHTGDSHDDEYAHQLATASGGRFYSLSDLESLKDDLKSSKF